MKALLIALPALLLFAFDLFSHHGDLAPSVALRLDAAQLVQQGLTPYVDFWDWSQPVNYWFCGLPFALNAALEGLHNYVPPELSFKAALFALVLFSLCLSLLIAVLGREALADDTPLREQVKELPLAIAAGYVIALFCTRFESGVLQQLFMLALIPWTIFRWFNYQQMQARPRGWIILAVLVGLFLGLGTILDLPHLPVVLGLELFFLAAYGRYKFDLAVLAGGAVTLADIIWLHLLPATMNKAFWQWTMPIRARQFVRFDASISAYVASPDRRDALYMMALSIVVALLLQVKQDFLRPLIVVAALGLALYVGEGDGLSSGLVVAIWGSSFIFAVACATLCRSLAQTKVAGVSALLPALPAVLLFLLGAAATYSLDRARDVVRQTPVVFREQAKTDIFDVINTNSKSGDPVIVLCDYPMPIYPLLFDLDRRPGSYLLWSRPLRVLNAINHFNAMTPALAEFEKFLYSRLESDISRGQSPLILVAKNTVAPVVENSSLKKALAAAYDRSGECYYCSVNKAPAEYCGFETGFDIYRRRVK
ncbi:MAG: hypothetical protein JST01_04670 [Cyanobacteria bacterium SZAS TMP-1]|nr:hypothetical protein [Cyanobacteria bacterium SZAS TMP-1]